MIFHNVELIVELEYLTYCAKCSGEQFCNVFFTLFTLRNRIVLEAEASAQAVQVCIALILSMCLNNQGIHVVTVLTVSFNTLLFRHNS